MSLFPKRTARKSYLKISGSAPFENRLLFHSTCSSALDLIATFQHGWTIGLFCK